MSPFDSVSFLRAAIQADVVHDMGTRTIAVNSTVHRQGSRGTRECPPFFFSYADGVAIDRGQEERLAVKDIAITSSSFCASGVAAEDQDQQWNGNTDGGESTDKDMCVLLRVCESPTEQDTTGESGSGVLHRWESMQGGFCGIEVISEGMAAGIFPKTKGISLSSTFGSKRLSLTLSISQISTTNEVLEVT